MTGINEHIYAQTWTHILNSVPTRVTTHVSTTDHDLKQATLHDIDSGEYTSYTLIRAIANLAYFTDGKPDLLRAYKRAAELLDKH